MSTYSAFGLGCLRCCGRMQSASHVEGEAHVVVFNTPFFSCMPSCTRVWHMKCATDRVQVACACSHNDTWMLHISKKFPLISSHDFLLLRSLPRLSLASRARLLTWRPPPALRIETWWLPGDLVNPVSSFKKLALSSFTSFSDNNHVFCFLLLRATVRMVYKPFSVTHNKFCFFGSCRHALATLAVIVRTVCCSDAV